MKKVKICFTFMTVLMLMVFMTSGFTKKVEAKETTKSQKYADAMEPGWNLGNTFDGFDTNGDKGEESWGNPKVTKELIKTIKSQGFKSIRMPFTSLMRTGEGPDYIIDEKFLDRYAEVVQWALDEDLYVMINLHHDSWNWAAAIGADWDNGNSMIRYKAIWTQLADYFKDYSDMVSFESLNEPQFWSGDEAAQIKINEDVNKEFYKIVRNSGGNNKTRMLILPTLNTNDSEVKCKSLYDLIKGFDDENIIATFHYYGYWPFSTNIAGTTTMDATVVRELEEAFDRVYDQFTANGIGVVCGEYGVLAFDKSLSAIEHGEMLKYFEYVNYYAKKKNITMMLWDNGQHMGRTTYKWSDITLYNTIKESWVSRSSYSESDRIFITDKNKTKDVKTELILNGNELVDIYIGQNKLVLNKDYTYKNNIVTLKGKFIKSIITNEYDVNAVLTMKFTAGADWKVFITHYKTPVVGKSVGTTDSYKIPVKYNGSRLSTIEAMYKDGTGAGPQNWTTFKEFDYAFKVDYNENLLILTKEFFAETNDGQISLKLHFQSGEVIDYTFNKNNTVVKEISTLKVPTLKSTNIKVDKNKIFYIKVKKLEKDAKITYQTSKKSVATVSEKGKVTGVKAGKAIITTTVVQDGISYSFKTNVTVNKAKSVIKVISKAKTK